MKIRERAIFVEFDAGIPNFLGGRGRGGEKKVDVPVSERDGGKKKKLLL